MIRHLRTAATLAALGLMASLAVAAAPEGCYVAIAGDETTTEDDVIACEQQQWFHRATTPASNVGYVAEPHGIATFDTNEPAGSVTGGNGGGYAAWSTLLVGGDDGLTDARFRGSYTGTLDRLDVDLHILVGTLETLDQTPVFSVDGHPIDIGLMINGAQVFTAEEVRVEPVPEENSSAGSLRLDFAITNVADLLASFDFPNGPDAVHEIELVVGSAFLDEVTIYAFDTTEVPGGIGFNRVDLPEGTLELSAN